MSALLQFGSLTLDNEILTHLVSASVRGSALLVLAAVGAYVWHRRSAGVRHLLWAAGTAALASMTAFGWLAPRWRVSGLPASSLTIVGDLGMSGSSGAAATGPVVAAGAAIVDAAGTGSAGSLPAGFAWLVPVALGVWTLGSLILALRLALGIRAARQLVSSARPMTDPRWLLARDEVSGRLGLAGRVPLLISPALSTPVVAGVLRPVVVLPAGAENWNAERRMAVLFHELAHVARHDCATQLFAELVKAVHWPNPLIWYASSRLASEREIACDEYVVAHGITASSYAEQLVALSALGSGRCRLGTPAPAMVGGSRLARRVQALLAPGNRVLLDRRSAALICLGALLLAVPVACLSGDPDEYALERGERLVFSTDPQQVGAVEVVIERRLREMGVPDARTTIADGRLVVELTPRTPKELAVIKPALMRRGRLELAIVEDDSPYMRRLNAHASQDPVAAASGVRVVGDARGNDAAEPHHFERYLEGTRPALEYYLASLPAALRLDSEHSLVLDQKGPELWRTFYLDDARSLTLMNVVGAEVHDPEGPIIEVKISLAPQDGARFEALTRENVGQRLAILWDRESPWGAPLIRSPISGGRLSLTLRCTRAEAQSLAGALRAGALPAPLELIEAVRL